MNKLEFILNEATYDYKINKFKKTNKKTVLIDAEAINSDGKNSVLLKGKLKDLSGGNDNYPVIVKRKPNELSIKNWIFECFITYKINELNDPHFANCIGIFLDSKNELALILTFYKNGSLKNYINNTNITIKEKIKHIIKLTQGLVVLDENEVNHCDIKIDNILLDDDNNIKITDFGSASLHGKHINSNINNKNNRIISRYTNNKYSLRIPKSLHDIDITKISFNQHKNVFDIWCLGITILSILFKISEMDFNNNYIDKSQINYKIYPDKINSLFDSLDVTNINTHIKIKEILKNVVMDCFKSREERPKATDLIIKLHPLTKLIV